MPSTTPATRENAPSSGIGSHPRWTYAPPAATWTAPLRTSDA
ncbi:hypothetical protein [Streptomyces pyxinae]|nr:hypothetical protein [Streptomyces sp. LP05-1]